MQKVNHSRPDVDVSKLSPFDSDLWQPALDHFRFAPQQRRIVELILAGQTYDAIASDLELHPSTVRTYLTRVCQRVGAGNRLELVLVIAATAIKLVSAPNQPSHQKPPEST